jgi:phosphatidylserine/phosphatidylglycerophosphate/cardiolipin synthase-like enzyme
MFLWPVAAQRGPISTAAVTRIYSEPAAGYAFFSAAIASARHDIDLSMYELKDPVIEAELVHQAKAGVRVRVLLNSAYGRSENAPAANVMRGGSVHVTWAPRGQIFHAKYLLIDDARVYIGTGNLVNYDYSSTRDFWVLDQVLGEVAAIEATFSSDVAGATSIPTPHGGLV